MTSCINAQTFYDTESIEAKIARAAALIPPVWPLKNAIACNPLLHLVDQPFWRAMEMAQQRYAAAAVACPLTAFTNRHLIKWAQCYLDEGVAALPMPGRHYGFYRAWSELAPFDDTLVETADERRLLASLPDTAAAAVAFVVDALGVPSANVDDFLASHLAQLPGWAGYFRWRAEWNRSAPFPPLSLCEFLAVRLAVYYIASRKQHLGNEPVHALVSRPPAYRRDTILAKERIFADGLVHRLVDAARQPPHKKRPVAQWVFCIDVRSEPLRYELERSGDHETFGLAGFFGLPLALPQPCGGAYSSCPVLVQPKWKAALPPPSGVMKRGLRSAKRLARQSFQELKYHFGTPFALAETIGVGAGLWMGLKSLAPLVSDMLSRALSYDDPLVADLSVAIPLQEQVDAAEATLRTMGLMQFAPVVVFCGHGSQSQNNPFASTLQCGACGAHHGGPNAHLLATMLNEQPVRQALRHRGISIPDDTLFIGAEHNTTTDDITFFTKTSPSAAVFAQLKGDVGRAVAAVRRRRGAAFGDAPEASEQTARRRSVDWSEVRPEWGLAGNGAFIIGPRWLSEALDMQGRVFLHSYDWQHDPEASSLEAIMTAPLVVAQWINAQYFFSTFDPVLFGSGSKTTHNVVGKIGVMQGNGSDLMHGLPLQSVYAADSQPYHEPLRLLAVVMAPRSLIEGVVDRQPILQKLFYNEWVHLVAIDPHSLAAYRLVGAARWLACEPPQASAATSLFVGRR